MTDDLDPRLDGRLRTAATAARASVHVSPAETEQALAEVTSGAHVTRLRPVTAPERRGLKVWLGVAAATALVATGGTWLLTRGPDQVTTTTDTTVPTPTAPEVVTTPPTPSETVTTSPGDPRDPFAGLEREPTGIARRCYEDVPCTWLMADPDDVLYSCDLSTNRITRHRPGDPDVVTELVACPLAVGPAEVAYVSEYDGQSGGDVAAVSVAAADGGNELGRWPSVINDEGLVPTPAGLATMGVGIVGPQPDLARPPVVEWVLPTPEAYREFPVAQIDYTYPPLVNVGGTRWTLPLGTHNSLGGVSAVATWDGGMLAKTWTDEGPALVRGWADGTLTELPLGTDLEKVPALLERTGTIIVPDADTFVRLDPFAGAPPAPSDWGGVVSEITGIPYRCDDGVGCTQVLAGPDGSVVAWQPGSNAVSRYPRTGSVVSFIAPGGTSWLVAAGPDDVAYLNVTLEPGVEGSAELVAVSLSAADPGVTLGRGPGHMGTDSDFVAAPTGLVQVGWYDQGWRPPADAPLVMAWLDRDGQPSAMPDVRVDAYADLVAVGEQEWQLTGSAAEIQPVGVPLIVATAEGGFLARYDEFAGDDPRSMIVRGRPDGTVEQWRVPDDVEPYSAVPEPNGSVLVPSPAHGVWVRLFPFAGSDASTEPSVDLAEAFAGWNWEGAGIERACGEVWSERQQMSQERCTQLAIDPRGVPVSYDPVTRVVKRERREGTEPVAFRLPVDDLDAGLLAAGPDDIVYFSLANEWPESSDVVAFSLAPGDAGRLIERFPGALEIGDVDMFRGSTGLVVSGWYELGPRPDPAAEPVVPWVARDGGDAPAIADAAFDLTANIVHSNGWQWDVSGRQVLGESPGTTHVVATFDGGFIALYEETTGDLRGELIRGWRDGHVEYAELPVSWFELGWLVLEPQGTLLIENGEWFVRVAPFAERSTGWDGRLEIDVEAGASTAVGLDEYLDTIEWPVEGQSHVQPWVWGVSPVTFANAVAGPLDSAAQLRTIEQGPVDAATAVVTVTDEGFLDDSVHGTRLVMHISLDQPGFRIERIEWSNACQPNRGHQDYRAEYCV